MLKQVIGIYMHACKNICEKYVWGRDYHTCEIMALKTLGIPEDLATVLSNLGLNKLGFPVWKLQKRRDGYSVNIFWRNTKKPRDTIPFSAHCEVMSQSHSQNV